jgi:hypothetical protein
LEGSAQSSENGLIPIASNLLPFFATLEWHSCSYLIPFCDGTTSVAYSVGSFSIVPHPLPRSCTSQIQVSRPSTFCTSYFHLNMESDSS